MKREEREANQSSLLATSEDFRGMEEKEAVEIQEILLESYASTTQANLNPEAPPSENNDDPDQSGDNNPGNANPARSSWRDVLPCTLL